MEQRVSIVTQGVADLDRSRQFYEHPGWRRSLTETAGVVLFQAGGMALALYPRGELAKDANIAESGQGFGGIALAYHARREEANAVLAEAEAAGARPLRPAQEAFGGGDSGYFSDPDGFPWELAWNPSFPLAEDGSLRLPN